MENGIMDNDQTGQTSDNPQLAKLDHFSFELQRRIFDECGRQYKHQLVMDTLSATNKNTKRAYESACMFIQTENIDLLGSFVALLDDSIEELRRKKTT